MVRRTMDTKRLAVIVATLLLSRTGHSHEEHSHPAPEKLGTVHFPVSCAPAVQPAFERAMALLHSFAYDSAASAFRAVAQQDPRCAMAHWGMAMSLYHPLWSPPSAQDLRAGAQEIATARSLEAGSERERGLIQAAAQFFSDEDPAHHARRAQAYEQAMGTLAGLAQDDEVQVLHALAVIATASPVDRTHAHQKRAAAILEPIYRRQPDHPGVAHYLIHACDSTELARQGLHAARAYARVAPSAPHALHMPSHIFTRLGLWEDSIASNEAARRAAHEQGDVGEELHAMDYLTYAYLQRGQEAQAERIVAELRAMGPLLGKDFKIGYASTAMPVRLAVERGRWQDAANVEAPPGSAPHVAALAFWARALSAAHLGRTEQADSAIAQIDACGQRAQAAGDAYWATQIGVLSKEARAWKENAAGHAQLAQDLLREAADAEDALEKLPVTPGPVVPAREQLGSLLLAQQQPRRAWQELQVALRDAPGRRAALQLAAQAAEKVGDSPVEKHR